MSASRTILHSSAGQKTQGENCWFEGWWWEVSAEHYPWMTSVLGKGIASQGGSSGCSVCCLGVVTDHQPITEAMKAQESQVRSAGRYRTCGCRTAHCVSLPRWRHWGKRNMYQKYLYFNFLKRKTWIIKHRNLISDWRTCCKIAFRYSGVGWALVFRAAVKEYFWFQASSSPPCLTQVPKLRWCPWLL